MNPVGQLCASGTSYSQAIDVTSAPSPELSELQHQSSATNSLTFNLPNHQTTAIMFKRIFGEVMHLRAEPIQLSLTDAAARRKERRNALS